MQMVVELKFQNEYLKSHFQDLKDVYADSAGSSVQAKEVDNDSKELKDKIEALNEELVIERQTRGAAEATLEHLRAEYIEADAKSQELEANSRDQFWPVVSEVPSVLEFMQRMKLEANEGKGETLITLHSDWGWQYYLHHVKPVNNKGRKSP
ncbi:hypothetical protein Tco_0571510 [Tanacetum coccineum]